MTMTPGTPDRAGVLAVTLGCLLTLGAAGCAVAPDPGLGLSLDLGPVEIPAGSAHARFQGGRQVGGASNLEPYCELEIATVSEQPQAVAPTQLQVRRVSQALLKDPITRIPALLAGVSCSDPVFWETYWWLTADRPSPVLWLRCIAPYYNCRIGGPLSPAQIQSVVGPGIQIRGALAEPGAPPVTRPESR
jgi:hypothetical protein